jgi:hypothetical protein
MTFNAPGLRSLFAPFISPRNECCFQPTLIHSSRGMKSNPKSLWAIYVFFSGLRQFHVAEVTVMGDCHLTNWSNLEVFRKHVKSIYPCIFSIYLACCDASRAMSIATPERALDLNHNLSLLRLSAQIFVCVA